MVDEIWKCRAAYQAAPVWPNMNLTTFLSTPWPAKLVITVISGFCACIYAGLQAVARRAYPASPPGSLSPEQLPIILKSGGMQLLPNAFLLVCIGAAFSYVIWLFSGLIFSVGLVSIIVLCSAAAMAFWARGLFQAIFKPNLVTIADSGVEFQNYKDLQSWTWDQIDHAEVRMGDMGRSTYTCPCLCMVRFGPQDAGLPYLLRSQYGVETPQSLCDLINAVLLRTKG